MTTPTKEQHVINFLKVLEAVESQMEPFKDHKREIRKNYVENGWLTREELRMAVKAYRLLKGDIDIEALRDTYNKISGKI
jgi:DNA-binding IscR family transcriptional regulator